MHSSWQALALVALAMAGSSEGLYLPSFFSKAKRDTSPSTASASMLRLGFQRTHMQDTVPHSAALVRRDSNLTDDGTPLDVNTVIDNIKIGYTVDVSIGTPPQNVTILLDTGSSDMWVSSVQNDACTTKPSLIYNNQSYNCQMFGTFNESESSTFKNNKTDFFIHYGDSTGSTGHWATDSFTLDNITVPDFSFGLGLESNNTLGVLGIGYPLNEVTYRNLNNASDFKPYLYENLPERLVRQKVIHTPAYSLWLNSRDADNGEILFGAVDHSKYLGNLTRLPIRKAYDGVQRELLLTLDEVKLSNDPKNKNKIDKPLPALLDSGTTLTYLPENVVDAVLNDLHGGFNPRLGSMVGECNHTGTLNYRFGGDNSTDTPGATIKVPYASLLTPVNSTDPDYANVCLLGLRVTTSKLYPAILGDSFLRSAYVVYDMKNDEMGLAQVNPDPPKQELVEAIKDKIPETPRATAVST